MFDIFKRKPNVKGDEPEEFRDKASTFEEDSTVKSQLNLIKQNEENLLHNLGVRIEDSANQTENLINAIESIANRVEEQIKHIYSVVDEISHYSAMAE